MSLVEFFRRLKDLVRAEYPGVIAVDFEFHTGGDIKLTFREAE